MVTLLEYKGYYVEICKKIHYCRCNTTRIPVAFDMNLIEIVRGMPLVHCNEINTGMPVGYQLTTSIIVSGMLLVHCAEINTGIPV